MNFRLLALKILLNIESIRTVPSAALQALQEGYDSPSLWILAGFSKHDDVYDILHYYHNALDELGIILPDKRDAAIEIALSIADEIFDNRRQLIEGVRGIKNTVIDAYPFYEESKHRVYDSISFENIYASLLEIEELEWSAYQWHHNKTNKELEAEFSLDLMKELREWYALMKNK
ncbi:MAG: hypothetical protein J7623_04855 [Chitinophaga sp.]|uniref:hypothetical protein n=1 Tax=Chitinophaga sp. TaxID=1869181 RepID=UPI001B18B53C|nr:hypothetical protein [Chitinophaga sp.]MBO9727947.1 hypothetical protein [Chitinophaga sp.]